ncbi:MAG: hypothetical protein QM808_03410 [Steroidobacteraceae bacterium]
MLRPRQLLTTGLLTPWLLLGCLLLTACGSGTNDDKVRIGSGQSTSTGTAASSDYPIFYVKRTTPNIADAVDDNLDDVRRLRVFNTNADLYMRDRASPSAAEHNITERVHPANQRWDVKDVDVSADGSKVIFAMRGPLSDDQEDKDPPTWNIWEYVIASDTLHRVISSNVIAEEGQDVSPHYLPDGHILFASTRQYQSKAVLLDENKPQFEAQDENRDESAFVLHVMDATGGNIQQITYNQSHDLDPTVLSDGRVLFSRWDHAPGGRNGVHFYTTNPNGTKTQLLYGSASHATIPDTDVNGATTYPTVQFTKAREMRDGRILTLIRPFNNTEYGGDLYIIDTRSYVENNQTVATPSGPAASKATPNNVRLLSVPSIGGRFVSAAPLWDSTDRILASWTQCRVVDPSSGAIVNCTSARLADPAFVAAPPIYGIWMFNPNDGTQQPVVAPVDGVMLSDVVVAQPHTAPTFLPYTLDADTTNVNATLKGEGVGVLDIRSVYDFDGAVGGGITSIANVSDPTNAAYTNRAARFLRIEKAVSIPDDDFLDDLDLDFNLGDAAPFTGFLREIVGYVPVEPDGSVKVKLPGNVAVQISVTDVDGRRISAFPRHNAWISVRPGETMQCNGCHTNSTNVPVGQSGRSHGRSGSFASVYAGAAGSTFSNTNTNFTAISAQTMAQARAVWSCANEQCASITPSVNLQYSDVWPTMPGSWNSARTGCTIMTNAAYSSVNSTCRNGDLAMKYVNVDTNNDGIPDGLQTRAPTSSICLTTWSNICRITINYLEHLQPIWELSRPVVDSMNNPVLDPNTGLQVNHQCIGCHTRTANNVTQIPAGQLELTSEASEDNPDHIVSYRELLFGDNALELNGTVLQDHCIQFVTDPVTMVQTCAKFETVSASLSARNARGSRFFTKFTSTGTHAGYLSSGELRLISEWVDIGAQYYNDPFKAPEN